MSNVPDLQPVAADMGRPLVTAPPRTKLQIQPFSANAVWTYDKSTSYRYHLNAKCQDFIALYLGQSFLNPNDPNMGYINRELLTLAFTVSSLPLFTYSVLTTLTYDISQHPFLMHASIAVALTYDRHQNPSSIRRRTLEECYHWSQGTALLKKRLAEPIKPADKDAIWGTAAALAILTFSSPDASTPGESWPLKPSPDHSDLDWLRMNEAKMSLWDIVNPLRPDSIFCVMAETFAQIHAPLTQRGMDGIPGALATLCLLDDLSTADTSPYFHAAHAVSQILKLPDSEVTTGPSLLFPGTIYGPFKDLLVRERHPVALVLLYLWYCKAGRSIWWIGLRARVEGPAIVGYLRRYHQGNVAVQEVLAGRVYGLAGC